jgi:tetratricopeptide (TPR) repeat protein
VLLANITGFESVWVELRAGRAAAAVEFAAQAFEVEAQLGEYTFAAIAAGTRARALYAAESFEEAEAWADRAAELAGRGEELGPAALWRHVKAKLLARRGESAEAERLALEACDLLGPTDYLNNQGDALLDFAEVLKVAGRAPEAARRAKEAFEAYEQKGNVAAREQAHAFLADLGVPV